MPKEPPAPDERGSEKPAKRDNFRINAVRYTSIAMSLPAAVAAGYIVGYALDVWLHTTYLKIVFLILGIVSGFAQLIQLLVRDMNREKTK